MDATEHPRVIEASLKSLLLVWRHVRARQLSDRVGAVCVRVKDCLANDNKDVRGATLDLWSAVLFGTEGAPSFGGTEGGVGGGVSFLHDDGFPMKAFAIIDTSFWEGIGGKVLGFLLFC